jgi:hypothetical protein
MLERQEPLRAKRGRARSLQGRARERRGMQQDGAERSGEAWPRAVGRGRGGATKQGERRGLSAEQTQELADASGPERTRSAGTLQGIAASPRASPETQQRRHTAAPESRGWRHASERAGTMVMLSPRASQGRR